MNIRTMENSNKALQHELKQMYARTEHWISDYAFFEDEIRFLVELLDHYFVGAVVSDSTNLAMLRETARKLTELDIERESIAKDNRETLQQIARLLKNEVAFDPAEFRENFADIENEQVGFLKRYREIKKEIYKLPTLLRA